MSDRFDRRRRDARAPTSCAGSRSARWRCSSLTGALELWHVRRARRRVRRGRRRSSARRSTRSCPTCCPAERARRRPTRSTSSCGPIALRLAGPALGGVLIDGRRRRRGVRARRALVRRLGGGAARDAPRAPRAAAARAARSSATSAAGFAFVRSHVWLWGTFVERRGRLPAVHGPRRGAAAATSSRTTSAAAPPTSGWSSPPAASARSAARSLHGPARAAAARHHVHVRRLDAGDARRRRLRARGRRLAADARQPRLQRAGDGGHDRLGDGQAAPRARPRCSAASRASTG